jgi:glycosyltransferase involved in cell wall biosynthesis
MGVKSDKIIKIYAPTEFVIHTSNVEILDKFRKRFTDQSQKIILFVGRLIELKGSEYLIRSLLEIKKFKVHLVIVGYGVLLDQLQNLTKSLGLENVVTFFGGANREELGLLHDISDVFVCPSIVDSSGTTESLGLVIPEAMESGLPVIGTAVGGIVEIIEHEVNGLLVEQKDPKAIAKAIEQILSDKEFEKKIIEKSKETVKEFSPEIIAKKYFDIIQNLVRENP